MKAVRYLACFLGVIAAFGLAVHLGYGAAAAALPAAASGFVLVAHGGAGDYSAMTTEQIEMRREAMVKAVHAGYAILAKGGAGLDAVEATIRVMEDSGQFNAGRGANYTKEGVPEMDAAIMDGRTLQAGSVAALKHIANPIHLARLVMEKTPHVMLVGEGAEEFARSQGIELVSPFYFYNQRQWEQYKKAKSAGEKKGAAILTSDDKHGTVGVVALDKAGNLAAGTSTGGTVMKMPGRVGDSPLIGAGTYANNEGCAVSATGTGEYFIRNIVAADICERVRYLHVSVEQAADDVVMKELVKQHGDGGVIALDRNGNVATPFNTQGMMNATLRADGKITIQGWSKSAKPIVISAK
ncbi:MAG TPA: isoaspartyl peptidase/L-asparaginase [Candidatus Acidoferrales bacterium]|nr:isoaspartyl peptidase/L-asparaginase [Candidatus Acidoferrales bacterium]